MLRLKRFTNSSVLIEGVRQLANFGGRELQVGAAFQAGEPC